MELWDCFSRVDDRHYVEKIVRCKKQYHAIGEERILVGDTVSETEERVAN